MYLPKHLKMKKYQRLLLITISIISLSLFLVYRQQYNRLHHVLEVFNFFGTPCNISDLQRSDSVLLEHDWGPQPFWQQLDYQQFTFSAFSVDRHTIEGLMVSKSDIVLPKSCLLLFEDGEKPFKGKLSRSKDIAKVSDIVAFSYLCKFANTGNDKMPFAIGFRIGHQEPQYVLVTNNMKMTRQFNVTICLRPSHTSKKTIFEFISFHNMLGINSFIMFYEQNVPHNIVKLLRNLSNTLNIWISFYPYNKPMTIPKEIATNILEYDCLLRTKNHSKFSLTLGVSDYIVPKDISKSPQAVGLPIKKFCLNHSNQNRPTILQNFESVDDHTFNDVIKLQKNSIKEVKNSTTIFDNHSCVIYRYEKCEKDVKTKTDYSVKRFSTDLTRTTLVQLLIHDQS